MIIKKKVDTSELIMYRNMNIIKKYDSYGMSKGVYLLKDDDKYIIRKEFVTSKSKYVNRTNKYYEREKYWLTKLADSGFTPKLLFIDNEKQTLYMEYCGDRVNKSQNVINKVNLFNEILINKYNCYHNDINWNNIVTKDNNIYIIDFERSSIYPASNRKMLLSL